MNINALDLNLLRVFDAVYTEGRVARAAERLSLSQPAVSNALGRLRRHFSDPLLWRTPRGMMPTPRGRELARAVGAALAVLREEVGSAPGFDPRRSSRRFCLAASDYLESALVGPLIARLRKEAPGVALIVRRVKYLFEPPADALESGECDAAIGFFGAAPAPQSGLIGRPLFEERYAAIARAGHPRIRARLARKTFLELDHVRVAYSEAWGPGVVDMALRSQGLSRKVALVVPHFLSIPPIVAATDLIGTVPERLARAAAAALALRIHRLPIALPAPAVGLVWHERTSHDPAQEWFRAAVEETAPL